MTRRRIAHNVILFPRPAAAAIRRQTAADIARFCPAVVMTAAIATATLWYLDAWVTGIARWQAMLPISAEGPK